MWCIYYKGMSNWDDLSIRERADLIGLYMDGGILDLPSMRKHYNSFAEGGDKSYSPSKSIKDYIKKTEAFRPNWYLDGNGIPTVGYGFTGEYYKNKYPDGMTKEQADEEFEKTISKFASLVKTHTPNYGSLSQNQKDALLSYMYNVGPGNYTAKSPKFQQALKDKDWNAVASHMDIGYNDKRNPGLRKRRDYERELFLSSDATQSLASSPFPNYYDQVKAASKLSLNPEEYSSAPIGMPSIYYAESSPYRNIDFSSPLPSFIPSTQETKINLIPRKGRRATAKHFVPEIPSNDEIIRDLFEALNNEYDVTL